VVEPFRFALALRPRWIALEQVPHVLPLWEVIATILANDGYGVWTGVLEAERYGVPQTRERAFLLARRGAAAHPPEPTHQRFIRGHAPAAVDGLFGGLQPWVSMARGARLERGGLGGLPDGRPTTGRAATSSW
jgi:DNA (cytosine-5)-methyltransferase 1